jgi:hypothetical protein
MEELCYYKLTVTKDKPTRDFYFPKKESDWYIGGFTWPEVLAEVELWYARGADCVEMEMITKEQFDNTEPKTYSNE